MTIRRSVLLPFFVAFGLVLALLLTVQSAAGADATGIAQADSGGLVDEAGDVFSAGRRAGFLWLALGLFATIVFRAVLVRLKPKDGTPAAGWRARLSLVIGGALAVVVAGIDMFASSRGLEPIATAATGAILLYYGGAADPARGSKRVEPEEGAPT